jgi:hypothetical protein
MNKKHVPIMHNIDFIDKMDALVREFPLLSQNDVKEFWNKYRYQVYEAYTDSAKWIMFYNMITDIVEK